MFLLLTQILLWLLITFILYNLLTKLVPKQYFTLLGGLFLFAVIVLAFFFPDDPLVSAAWRVLSFPLTPVGACILLLSISMRQGLDKSKNYIVAALIILLLSSTPLVSNLLVQSAEIDALSAEQRRQLAIERDNPGAATNQTASAIVLLGRDTTQARILPDGQRQVQLTDKGDRILHTDRIYQQQLALGSNPLIIVSAGPRPAWQGNGSQVSEANDIAQVLVQLGVPQDRIVPEPFSINMHSSAEQVKRILEERGLVSSRIFVVTSGISSRRARLTFANVGLNVVPQPTDFQGPQLTARSDTAVTTQPFLGSNFLPPIRVESFVPSVEALTVTTRVWEETLIRIYYILRGWTSPGPL